MNKDSMTDYLSYILFKAFGFVVRKAPKRLGLFLGRRIGDVLYCFDLRHRAIAYANIKTALGKGLSSCRISNLTREFYRSFVQNLFEIFYIPMLDKEYFQKYVNVEGSGNISEGFKRGKGIIFLAMHEGSWELSNIISSNIGFTFNMFVRDQKRYRRVEGLLNSYRQKNGCKLIQRRNQTRQLIEVLKNNEGVGMTLDQGGKTGVLVKFFGKEASMASGAVRLALKYDVALLPVFYTRLNGPFIKLIIEPPFEIIRTGEDKKDIQDNLQRLVYIFEGYIAKYPSEYLWTYKIWKYGLEKNILILSDGKTGHLRQSQAAANIISGYLKTRGFKPTVEIRGAKFKIGFSKFILDITPDIIISCGSQVAPINYILSREIRAKSIVIMRPPFLMAGRYDLEIIPEHDKAPKRGNIVVTEGALNLIDERYLKEQSDKLMFLAPSCKTLSDICIGLLIGGDTKRFHLKEDVISVVIKHVKSLAEEFNADILLTTSRRTPEKVEALLKAEFKDYSRCKLLIIANEKNIPEAVGGILGLSHIVVTSPESVSMVSEAASSKRYVFVFKSEGLSNKHRRFLENFAENKYIYMAKAEGLSRQIKEVWLERPAIKTLNDSLLINEALKSIL
ncbi:MAG: ELM1/GtrOC1 family putative glycosyltransferase [Candidatus Omnitrophota bacterium]